MMNDHRLHLNIFLPTNLCWNYISIPKTLSQQGYNIAKLSLETGIPQHHLSALLNKVYGVRFNDFINQYRIRHIANHFDKSSWEQMTLEGIASESGFNSRTTFFNAIKKSTGLSPSEFISKIKMDRVSSQQGISTTHH
jgi:AraC-like DNA-binding protein